MAATKKKPRRHKWQEIGSGNQQCKACGMFRVERHKPGQLMIKRAIRITYEKRDPKGAVLWSADEPGSCVETPVEQLGLLDLSRFE